MRQILFASAALVVLGTGSALANSTLDAILASPTYAGATINETHVGLFGITVDAVLANGTVVENRYRLDGTLRKSEATTNGATTETRYDANGNVVSTQTSSEDNSTVASVNDQSDDHGTDSSSDSSSSNDNSGGDSGGSDD